MGEDALAQGDGVEGVILFLRGHRIILDRDLATLYGVTTGNLNKAVDRNADRFPADFVFRLTSDEFRNLIFHFGRSNRGGNRRPPRAFTEHGVAMLSSVLRGARAAQVNIEIMRAFIRLRQMTRTNAALAAKIAALEKRYDTQFKVVFDALRELMEPPTKPAHRIGFGRDD
jgi:hypothetical protein